MPELGEIVKDCRTVGYNCKKPRAVIWHACIVCGVPRWVFIKYKKPVSLQCCHCNGIRGEKNHNWKGGWYLDDNGYKILKLQRDDFFYSMTDGRGYTPEHRLFMAQHLKRCLLPWEIVHHKNGIKDDNRLENLQLLPNGIYHVSDSTLKQKLRYAQKKIAKQALEIKELKYRLKLRNSA